MSRLALAKAAVSGNSAKLYTDCYCTSLSFVVNIFNKKTSGQGRLAGNGGKNAE